MGVMDVKIEDVVPTDPPKVCCCGCCSLIGFIMIILFFPATVTQLGQFKIGLSKNKVTGVVNLDDTFTPGRYWIGFWKEFIEFPSTLKTIEFSDDSPEEGVQHLTVLRCRDNEGKQLFLDISVQYQLIPSELGQLYREMNLLYEDLFISDLRDAFSRAGNQFVIRDIWTNQQVVRDLLTASCRKALQPRHATCWGVQLWGVRFEPRYETKITQEQVRKQEQRTENMRQRAAVTRADTKVMVADYEKNITIIQGEGNAKIFAVEKQAVAEAAGKLISAEAEALQIVREALKYDTTNGAGVVTANTLTDSQLVTYQKYMMMLSAQQAHFVYTGTGVTAPSAINAAASRGIMNGWPTGDGAMAATAPAPAPVASPSPSPETRRLTLKQAPVVGTYHGGTLAGGAGEVVPTRELDGAGAVSAALKTLVIAPKIQKEL